MQRHNFGSLQPPLLRFKCFSCLSFPSNRDYRCAHHGQLNFLFLVEMRFHHAGQGGLKLLASNDLSACLSLSKELLLMDAQRKRFLEMESSPSEDVMST